MKYSANPSSVYAVCFTHYLHDKPLFIFGYIIDPNKKNADTVNALLDHLWERGFTDGLCYRI